ncbi:MAG: rhodanese-like domain-containing protein [Deltaproteobacteria bacterium]|nr:rhodanese-like domain-containing protein [Deltaproteobacteria bacterium]
MTDPVASYEDVTPAEVARGLPGHRLIDVRESGELVGELGHIAGVELVPLGILTTVALPWDRHAPLVMICRSGARSGRATQALARMGFTSVHNMVGGMLRWNAEGLPVERG